MKTAFAFAAIATAACAQTGHWEGKIKVPQRELPIVVDLAKNSAGAWIGSMTVVGSSSVDVPLSAIGVEGAGVKFKANLPELSSFAGAMSEDGASISGSAANSQGDAPFELTRKGEANVKIPRASSALSKDFAGTWEGLLKGEGQPVHLQLRLAPAADGTATAMLVVLEQNNMEIPASTVTIDGKRLELESRAVSGKFK